MTDHSSAPLPEPTPSRWGELSPLEERLEACRPGEDDHLLPEMRELRERLEADPAWRRRWQQVQVQDRRLAERLQEVPIPAGLEERLLQACRAAVPPVEGPAVLPPAVLPPAVVPPAVVPPVEADGFPSAESRGEVSPATRRFRMGRRAALSGGILAAAALLAGLFAWPYLESTPPPPWPELAAQVPAWERQLDSTAWRAADASPARYPPSPAVRVPGPRRWQVIRTALDPQTVVYDYAVRQPQGLLLYVARPDSYAELPSAPPLRPVSTGGWSVAAWQQSEIVYVLALRGGEQEYRAAVTSPQLASR